MSLRHMGPGLGWCLGLEMGPLNSGEGKGSLPDPEGYEFDWKVQ